MLLALLRTVIAAAALLAQAAAVPPLSVPADFAPAPFTAGGTLQGLWTVPARSADKYPTRIEYFAIPNRTLQGEIDGQHSIAPACTADRVGVIMQMTHLCGYEIDRDETCAGKPAHRFVRRANFGPPVLVAHTELVVPWGSGILEVVYDRRDDELAVKHGHEVEDPVLADMRALCEAASAAAPPAS